jgi:hypothetical protein
VAVSANARDRFLADVATLGEADGLIDSAHFLRQVRVVYINSVPGRAGFDAQRMVDLTPGGSSTGFGQCCPESPGAVALTNEIVPGERQRFVRANAELGLAQRHGNVSQGRQIPQRPADCLLDHRLRLGTCKMQPDQLCRAMGELHLLGDQVMVEVRQKPVRRPGRDDKVIGVLPCAGRHVLNDRMTHDLALAGREERFTGRARGQMDDVVGAKIVQEDGGVGPRDLNSSLVGKIEENGTRARALVLDFGLPVVQRNQPAGLVLEYCPEARSDVFERCLLSHPSPLDEIGRDRKTNCYSASTAMVLWASSMKRHEPSAASNR